jgi:hypothetical protein
MGHYAEAKTFYERALAIFETTLEGEHPHRLLCAENYAALVAEME